MKTLGYEQLIALKIIRDIPDMEGSEICKLAGCSFDELFDLHKNKLIDVGMNRLKKYQVNPIITESGLLAVKDAENTNMI